MRLTRVGRRYTRAGMSQLAPRGRRLEALLRVTMGRAWCVLEGGVEGPVALGETVAVGTAGYLGP